ncbi:MAG TPA: phage tail protein [Pyrinomonadaceae bacterium]
MDVNGTRFHLLLNEEDWYACGDGRGTLRPPAEGTQPDERRPDLVLNERAELTLRPLLFQFVTPPKDTAPSLHVRRGAARDRFGNWYWIDSTARRVQVFRADTQTVETFWPPPEPTEAQPEPPSDFRPREVQAPALLRFLGLTVTESQYLVVGVLEPAGLLVFDLYSDNSPLQILWPEGTDFAPFDMAAAPGGGVWILDRKNRCFWALDRNFNVLGQDAEPPTGRVEDFQPRGAGQASRRTLPADVPLKPSPIEAENPIAIEALPDGTVLILDSNPELLDEDPEKNFALIHRYRFGRRLGQPVSTAGMKRIVQRDVRTDFRLRGFDFAFVPQHNEEGANVPHKLYVAASEGNQVFAFALTWDEERLSLEPLPDYLPMRIFGGKGLASVGTGLFYDFGDGWIPLVAQRRPRYLSGATLYTPLGTGDADESGDDVGVHAFDAREPDCVWHRLMLDACIPPETEVRVFSRAANDERELALTEWRPEPALYLRGGGSELPFLRRQTGTAAGEGTWELLFQRARGRYLQLKLELTGNGRTTPRLRALRAYYPRFSYLEHYLPAVYSEDAQSASFLDRFLSNFEGLFTALEDRVAAAQTLFDVRGAPAESLEWLAGWLGVALDPALDEYRRRLFIKHAPAFFLRRGTAEGLRMALRLALDECPGDEIFVDDPSTRARNVGIRIVERHAGRRTLAARPEDATAATDRAQPRLLKRTGRWRPEQGRTVLHERFTEFLFGRSKDATGGLVAYTITPQPERRDEWTQFSRETLGFVPAATATELQLWQDFLKRRYRSTEQLQKKYKAKWASFAQVPLPGDMPLTNPRLRDWLQFLEETQTLAAAGGRKRWQGFLARRYQSVAKLNEAYGTHWADFEVTSLPDGLPPDGAPLRDWYQFEAVMLPMHEGAHHFTVLLPVRNYAAYDGEEEQRRHSLARRIVNLEKPAHTVFDMKFYWELFRVGEARLGEDTVIDLGSRAPQLMSPLVLGQGHLAETYVPARVEIPGDRAVLGREQLKN